MQTCNKHRTSLDHFVDSKFGELSLIAALAFIWGMVLWDGFRTPLTEESVETGQVVVYDSLGNVLTNTPEGTRSDHVWIP